MVVSYRLNTVTIALSVTMRPQFAVECLPNTRFTVVSRMVTSPPRMFFSRKDVSRKDDSRMVTFPKDVSRVVIFPDETISDN